MSASTCKCKGVGNFRKKKRTMIFTWCRKQNSDFISLQKKEKTQKRVEKMNGKVVLLWLMAVPINVGVAILVKKSADCAIHSKILHPLRLTIKCMF